jgi:MFS family permease
LLLVITYLTAILPEKTTRVRKVLLWIGGIMLIPLVVFVIESGRYGHWSQSSLPWNMQLFGWAAMLLPLLLAWWLRGKHVWFNVIAVFWVAALSLTSLRSRMDIMSHNSANDLALYAVCALGAVGLIVWGMKESRKERVNLGIAGCALTILFFYFSTVMDKLGRSASLIGLGLLFLLGGWLLEKTRRRLLTKMSGGAL